MSRAARLGAFIVLTLTILVAGVFIIGNKQYLFSSTYQVRAQFSNVAGLDAGGDVRVGGVHSGTVHSIALPNKPGDKVTVFIDLSKSTHAIIKQDSIATIETEGMLGNQYLAISFGSAGSPDVRNGDMLASQQPLEMADLLKKVDGVLESSQQAIQNTTQATASLKSISAKIDQGEGTVGALVNDRELYSDLQQTAGAVHDTMVQARAGVTDFQENMEALKHNFLLRGYFKSRGYEDSADLAKNELETMPQATPIKQFTYSSKQLFDKQDSAKLKNQKSLQATGEFLANNQFGFAVVVVSAGKEGDSQKELVLTEARAMVVREYLVENFGFEDSQLKTLGTGKQADTNSDGDWGTVQILIYPAGAVIPHEKQPQTVISSTRSSGGSVPVPSAVVPVR
jgi:phospholipid/cholesterol/gamma-HCH transport system substrate-binding protein